MWGLLMSGEVASTVVMFMPGFTKINRFVKRYSKPSACCKWVPVTAAWRVLKLRMEERLSIWRVAANILNKQSRAADKGWSSSVGWGGGVLRGANDPSP